MARDYTKYTVEGLAENLNKRQLVFAIVKDWASKNTPSFDEIQAIFPDEVQGSKGFIAKESEVKDPKRFNMKEPLTIKNGMHVVVCNQWGDNLPAFLEVANRLGYTISKSGESKSGSFVLSTSTGADEIEEYIKNAVESKDEKRTKSFKKLIIDFINDNQNCYWIIPFSNSILLQLEYKNEDEGLNWEDFIRDMRVQGKELNFNPKNIYSLYYHCYEDNFQIEEDDDDIKSFFDLISDNFLQLNIEEFENFTDNEYIEFRNTSISVLYCTICKMCEEHIRQDEMVALLLSVFNDPISEKFEMGDEIWYFLKTTLISLHVDLEDFEEEDTWDGYLHNWPEIAEYLFDNDVFDNDYIPS